MSDTAGGKIATEGSQPIGFERNVTLAAQGITVIFAGRMFGAIHRFALAILLARLLGPEQFGLYNLTLNAATIVGGLALLGMDTGLVRYVSTFASRRDAAGLRGVLQLGVGIPIALSLVVSVGLFVLAHPIAEQWFHEPRLAPLLQLASLLVPFLTLSDVISGASRGFKNQHYTVIAKFLCQPIVKTGALVTLAIFGLNAERAIGAYLLAVIATALLLLYFLNKQSPLRHVLSPARRDTREVLTFSLPVYFSTVITTFRTNIQAIILGTLTTISTVGIFALASNVNMVGRLIHSSITTAAMPIIAELYDRGDKRQLERFYQVTTKWTFTLNLPLFLLVVLFPEELLSIFGEDFLDGAQALTILAWSSLLATATGTNGPTLDMTGYTKLRLFNSVTAAAVTIGLNVLLIPAMGMLGAAWASLTSTAILELLRLAEVFIVLHILPYNTEFVKPLVAGVAAWLAVLASRHFVTGHENHLQSAMNAGLLFVTYVSAILLLGLNQEDRMLLRRVRRRIKLA